jgi:hypothetical protein
MAYIDKITTMRRVALVYKGYPNESNGAIVWEGVNIEGTLLLQRVMPYGHHVLTLEDDRLGDFCQREQLEPVYQDAENEDSWEPRANLTNERSVM